jgi:hypothetical protein
MESKYFPIEFKITLDENLLEVQLFETEEHQLFGKIQHLFSKTNLKFILDSPAQVRKQALRCRVKVACIRDNVLI